MTKILIISGLMIILSGCEYLGMAREKAADGVAKAIVAECAIGMDARQQNFQAIVDALATDQRAERPSALDCDGDGAPDF